MCSKGCMVPVYNLTMLNSTVSSQNIRSHVPPLPQLNFLTMINEYQSSVIYHYAYKINVDKVFTNSTRN